MQVELLVIFSAVIQIFARKTSKGRVFLSICDPKRRDCQGPPLFVKNSQQEITSTRRPCYTNSKTGSKGSKARRQRPSCPCCGQPCPPNDNEKSRKKVDDNNVSGRETNRMDNEDCCSSCQPPCPCPPPCPPPCQPVYAPCPQDQGNQGNAGGSEQQGSQQAVFYDEQGQAGKRERLAVRDLYDLNDRQSGGHQGGRAGKSYDPCNDSAGQQDGRGGQQGGKGHDPCEDCAGQQGGMGVQQGGRGYDPSNGSAGQQEGRNRQQGGKGYDQYNGSAAQQGGRGLQQGVKGYDSRNDHAGQQGGRRLQQQGRGYDPFNDSAGQQGGRGVQQGGRDYDLRNDNTGQQGGRVSQGGKGYNPYIDNAGQQGGRVGQSDQDPCNETGGGQTGGRGAQSCYDPCINSQPAGRPGQNDIGTSPGSYRYASNQNQYGGGRGPEDISGPTGGQDRSGQGMGRSGTGSMCDEDTTGYQQGSQRPIPRQQNAPFQAGRGKGQLWQQSQPRPFQQPLQQGPCPPGMVWQPFPPGPCNNPQGGQLPQDDLPPQGGQQARLNYAPNDDGNNPCPSGCPGGAGRQGGQGSRDGPQDNC